MAQTHDGAMLALARRAGVTVDELRARQSCGEKWCYRCKRFRPTGDFVRDRSRYDGLAAVCASCRSTRTTPGPTIRERRVRRADGLAWCSGCAAWLPAGDVRAGKCREHRAAYERNRYATDERYNLSRRHRSAARKRGVEPVPLEMKELLTETFGGLCAYCEAAAVAFDHIEAVVHGGQTVRGLIVPTCIPCNSSKKDRDLDDWLAKTGRIAKHELINEIVMRDV